MKTLSLIVLGLFAVAVTGLSEGSSFCSDEQSRESNKGCLLKDSDSSESSSSEASSESGSDDTTGGSSEASGSGSGSGSGSAESSSVSSVSKSGKVHHCVLIEVFLNISLEITDVTLQNIFIEWINEIEISIIESSEYSDDEKLVQVWAELQVLFAEYPSLENIVAYTYIPVWGGYVQDLEGVSLYVQSEITTSIVQLGSGGDCALFDALLNVSSSDSTFYSLIESLIAELKEILEDSSISFSYQLVLIYEKIEAFFASYPQYEAEILSANITGYGAFSGFFDVSATYFRIFNFNTVFEGGADSCEIVSALETLFQNTSLDIAVRQQIGQLITVLENKYSSVTDFNLRLTYFIEQFYEWILVNEWNVQLLYSLEIEGYGNLYQLILAYTFEQQFGITFNTGTTVATTEAATTTAALLAECSEYASVLVFSSNTTLLLTSITKSQASGSWTSAMINNFAPYKLRIYNDSKNTTLSSKAIYLDIVKVLSQWTTVTSYKTIVNAIIIETWGSVSQYIACNSTVSAS